MSYSVRLRSLTVKCKSMYVEVDIGGVSMYIVGYGIVVMFRSFCFKKRDLGDKCHFDLEDTLL